MPNGLFEALEAIRNALVDDLQSAWPDLVKVHKVRPEIEQLATPLGWVIRNGPIAAAETGSTRNLESFVVTFNMGGRFEKPASLNIDTERFDRVSRLFDVLTAEAHHGTVGYLPQITEMLGEDGEPDDRFIEVDLDFRIQFDVRRADAV